MLATIALFVGCFFLVPYGTVGSTSSAKKLDYNALSRRFSLFSWTRMAICMIGLAAVAVFYVCGMMFPFWLAGVTALAILWMRDWWVIRKLSDES